uniref:Putative secreted protein n=1 Tax=Anopheles darlingi TaxID=43151 RepID=A0A2M4D9A0_ANODA
MRILWCILAAPGAAITYRLFFFLGEFGVSTLVSSSTTANRDRLLSPYTGACAVRGTTAHRLVSFLVSL